MVCRRSWTAPLVVKPGSSDPGDWGLSVLWQLLFRKSRLTGVVCSIEARFDRLPVATVHDLDSCRVSVQTEGNFLLTVGADWMSRISLLVIAAHSELIFVLLRLSLDVVGCISIRSCIAMVRCAKCQRRVVFGA